MKKRVLIAAGGTGGHIFPSLSLANELVEKIPKIEILFAGNGLSQNPYFQDFTSYDISSGLLGFSSPFKLAAGLWQTFQGVGQAHRLIREFAPDAVCGFGSYHSLPVLLASKICRVPLFLHEQNSVPGRVNRLLSRFACVTGVQFPSAKERLKGKTAMVQMLLRKSLSGITRDKALAHFGLTPEKKTLLIMGGSQGALAINRLVSSASHHMGDLQIIHLTGKTQEEYQKNYEMRGVRACVKNFETQMDFAWQAADFLIGRAGAGTVAEMIRYRVPGILIPYPFAMDRHQEGNADFIAALGGGVKLLQHQASPSVLATLVKMMLEPKRLAQMESALDEYFLQAEHPSMADLIGEHLDG